LWTLVVLLVLLVLLLPIYGIRRKIGRCAVAGEWLNSLKEEEGGHNTAATPRDGRTPHPVGPAKNPKTPIKPPSKTSNTPESERLGLIATWSHEFGFVSIHDPTTGEWHDLTTGDAPDWAVREAFRRKDLYRSGVRKAYRLTSREMEEIRESERSSPGNEDGIVEEFPVEGG
jgi:hypothetical protein